MKKEKCTRCLIWVLLGGCLLGLGWFNLKNNPDFWDASFVNCITMVIAVVLSFFLTQKNDDRRKQKDILVEMILKLQLQFSKEDMYRLSGKNKEEITMRNRDLNNKLHILANVAQKFDINEEVSFVNEKFKEYEEFIGDHIDDLNYLNQSEKELQRPLGLIEGKLTEMALKLYQ